MIQRRAARWVLGRYDRLDSDMLSSLKWRSLELRRSDARLCMLCKQCNATSFRENIRAERTPGSCLSVIDLNSHVVHVIIIAPGQLHSGTISHQKL